MAAASVYTAGLSALHFTRSAAEISAAVADVCRAHTAAVEAIVRGPRPGTFANSFAVLAKADGDAAVMAAQCCLPALVSSDAAARTASAAAKEALRGMWTTAYSRPDLYEALQAVSDKPPTPAAARLAAKTLAAFRRSGCALPTATREKVVALSEEEARLQGQFEQHLNEDVSKVSLAPEETAGLSPAVLGTLTPDPEDPTRRFIGLKAPQFVPFMQQATEPSARRRVAEAFDCVGAIVNTPLLERLVALRHERAVLLGFASHAEFRLADTMAGDPPTVDIFLRDLVNRLTPRLTTELADLAALKRTDWDKRGIPFDGQLNAWDVAFYSERLQRERYGVDQEALRRWFPLHHVRDAMFRAYEGMLGLTFHPIPNETAPSQLIWHPDVELFAVTDAATGALLGHFLLDLFSRPGKYSHQCVVPLAPCQDSDVVGQGMRPVCAMLGNLTPPTASQPSLLRPLEVETLFHEFGHVMHALCTTVPFSRLSWTWPMMPWPGGVEQDFLEVPSMALQQFVFDPAVIRRLAKPDETGGVLDASTIQKLADVRFAFAGMLYRRIAAMSLFDLQIHSSLPPYEYRGTQGLDLQGLWHEVMADLVGYPPIPGTFRPASWYHMVTGYDVGYYGYIWADVLAADVLGVFEAKGDLLDPALGRRFRDVLLAPCGAEGGADMVRHFLGRPPENGAFLRLLGIEGTVTA